MTFEMLIIFIYYLSYITKKRSENVILLIPSTLRWLRSAVPRLRLLPLEPLQWALVLLELLLRHPPAKLAKNEAEGVLHRGQHHKKQRAAETRTR
jgi:hypothetical protein